MHEVMTPRLVRTLNPAVLKLVGTPQAMLVERFQIMWPDGGAPDLQVRGHRGTFFRTRLTLTSTSAIFDEPGVAVEYI